MGKRWNYCPECKNMWQMTNREGDFRYKGFVPYTKNSKTKKCPACKEPKKYRKVKARCLCCNEWFTYKRGKNKPYCSKCEKKEGEGQ